MSNDVYGIQPHGKMEYLQHNGWHFTKRAYEWAVKRMVKKPENGQEQKIRVMTMQEVDELLAKHGVKLMNDNGYDKCYLVAKCMADYLGSSVADEAHMAKHVKDVLDDYDGGEERVFRHWYSDMMEDGVVIPWEDIV